MRIEIHGLEKLLQRMAAYPAQLTAGLATTMAASLATLWSKVPPYPPKPVGSTYRRQNILAKSLGSSPGGGASGVKPGIFTIRRLGSSNYEGRFGTKLDYAPYVIGEGTQAGMHSSNWWTIKTVADRAADKINGLWSNLMEHMASFLG